MCIYTALCSSRKDMDKKNMHEYEVPQVEIIEVEVEKGFAISNTTTTNDLQPFGYEEGF